jgi:hypothetical protein
MNAASAGSVRTPCRRFHLSRSLRVSASPRSRLSDDAHRESVARRGSRSDDREIRCSHPIGCIARPNVSFIADNFLGNHSALVIMPVARQIHLAHTETFR